MDKKKSIAVAGTVIVDRINEISAYPKSGELTQILGIQKAIGGCVPNVALDLKKICPALTVRTFGRIGEDEDGQYVRQTLTEAGLDVTGLRTDMTAPTSFTEVMSVTGGQRTFFTYSGASAAFGAEDVNFGEDLPETLVLTSDGIHDYVDTDLMEDALADSPTCEEAAQILARKARENGSKDDQTLIILRRE